MSSAALQAELTVPVRGGRFTVTANLRLERGVLVLFGPSGAGKTLTLRAIAGLERISRGWLRVHGEELVNTEQRVCLASHRRRLGYVPQHASLFPFCDVASNVAFGLPWRERLRPPPRVQALLEELGIAHLAKSAPASLSGGERQRVALARALICNPRLLLLDEPFASLDEEGRHELRGVLKATLARHGTSALLVTHDPEEALDLGTEVVWFERGRTTVQGNARALLRVREPALLSG